MISVGDICVVRQTGSILWIAKGPALDPNDRERWTLITRRTDRRGRSSYETRVAGAGDVIVVKSAPEYNPAVSSTQPRLDRPLASRSFDRFDVVVVLSVP
jgi:hypothetical protein